MKPFRQLNTIVLMALVSWGIGACGSTGGTSLEQTLVAENQVLSTEVAILRATVTRAADDRAVTLDAGVEQQATADTRQDFIAATISGSIGLPTLDMAQITPFAFQPSPTPGGAQIPAGGVTQLPQAGSVPVDPAAAVIDGAAQAAVPAPVSTVDPNLPNLTNISASTTVGGDDCATAPATQFDTASANIYIVGTTNNFSSGTTLDFQWVKDGVEVYRDSFVYEVNNGVCIWYNFTPDMFVFTAGTYVVNLTINGQPAAPPLTLTMIGGSAVPVTDPLADPVTDPNAAIIDPAVTPDPAALIPTIDPMTEGM